MDVINLKNIKSIWVITHVLKDNMNVTFLNMSNYHYQVPTSNLIDNCTESKQIQHHCSLNIILLHYQLQNGEGATLPISENILQNILQTIRKATFKYDIKSIIVGTKGIKQESHCLYEQQEDRCCREHGAMAAIHYLPCRCLLVSCACTKFSAGKHCINRISMISKSKFSGIRDDLHWN